MNTGPFRPSTPSLLLGLVMMGIGLYLSFPTLMGLLTYERVSGRVLAVYDTQLGEGQSQLAIVFDYQYQPPQTLGSSSHEYWALGSDLCDRSGRPLPPLVVADSAVQAWRQRLLLGHERRLQYVYYDPATPTTSARMFIGHGGTSMFMESVGMVLLCAPPIAWSLTIICMSMVRLLNQRRTHSLREK